MLFSTALVAQPLETLTPKDIDNAIEWGTHGDPSPYLLHYEGRAGAAGRDRNPVIVGVVYTPSISTTVISC